MVFICLQRSQPILFKIFFTIHLSNCISWRYPTLTVIRLFAKYVYFSTLSWWNMFCGRYQEGNFVLTDTRRFSNNLEYRITLLVSSTKQAVGEASKLSTVNCSNWKGLLELITVRPPMSVFSLSNLVRTSCVIQSLQTFTSVRRLIQHNNIMTLIRSHTKFQQFVYTFHQT